MSKYCTKCGFQNDNDDLFCVSCGNPLKPAPQPQTAPQSVIITEYQSAQTDAAANKPNIPEVAVYKRKVGVCILLSFITLGIYAIYWQYLLVKNVRAIKGDDSSCTGEMLCLLFVPFYSYYWWYTRGDAVKRIMAEHNYQVSGSGTTYLVLSIFGLSIVAAAIMQNDFNSLPDIIEGADGQQPVIIKAPAKEKKPMSAKIPALFFIIASVVSIIFGFIIKPYITLYPDLSLGVWGVLGLLAIAAIAIGMLIKQRLLTAAGSGVLAIVYLVYFITRLKAYGFFTEFNYVLTPLIFAFAAAAFACMVFFAGKKPLGKLLNIPWIVFASGMVFHFIVWEIVIAASYGIEIYFDFIYSLLFSAPMLFGYIFAAKLLKAEEQKANSVAEPAQQQNVQDTADE